MSWGRFLALLSGLGESSLLWHRLEKLDWRSQLRQRLGMAAPTRVVTWDQYQTGAN